MKLSELKELIAQGESDTLDFKRSTKLLSKVFEALCGFLNKTGGIVLVGVCDNGSIVGQEIGEQTMLKISWHISQTD